LDALTLKWQEVAPSHFGIQEAVIPAGTAGIQTAWMQCCQYKRSVSTFRFAFHGDWIPAVPAGMTVWLEPAPWIP